ncbi:MAG: O-antigen ligase family protein [Synergistota bacterium]|nr:O-antigen ligase family protein [Synergistota bacterium]
MRTSALDFGLPVPRRFAALCFFTALVLPNLVFSGVYFYNTLHLMKWTVAMVPPTVLGVFVFFRVARRGTKATGFHLDGFATVWLALLLYMTVQPLWARVRSMDGLYQEWFFLSLSWMVYVLFTLGADERITRACLWGGLVNAVVNVVFAEMQIRGLNEPFHFIIPAPFHYIGNTGQQNMLALWLAMNCVGGSFLLMMEDRRKARAVAGALLAVCFWGLLQSTSRSGVLAFATGFMVLSAFFLRTGGKKRLVRVLLTTALLVWVGVLNLAISDRIATLGRKFEEMLEQPTSLANRASIWATSWTMFARKPVRGVGLGQYKWNYLHSQREMHKRWPHSDWMYTHWAHNEFLQWFAEGGIVGGALMLFLWGWWAWSAWLAFWRKTSLSPEACWGNAMVALFGFNAIWTRPFHRIENVLWLVMAFALANREQLQPLFPLPSPKRFEKGGRLLAGVVCAFSLAGLLFFANGIRADRLMRLSTMVEGDYFDPRVQEEYTGYLHRATGSAMTRHEARLNLAYNKVVMGESSRNTDMIVEGLRELVSCFEREPHQSELHYLLAWAPRLGKKDFTEYFESFGYDPEKHARKVGSGK